MDPGTILATVELAAKALLVTYEYYKNAKGAKRDIERLRSEIEGLQSIFSKLLDNAASVTTSAELRKTVTSAQNEMTELLKKLDFGRRDKAMHKVGLRSLVWPLNKRELEDLVNNLEKYKTAANLCLGIDQRYEVCLFLYSFSIRPTLPWLLRSRYTGLHELDYWSAW